MFQRSARLTAAGLAAGTALALFGGAGASQAAPSISQPAPSTVQASPILQPNSNIRTGPGTSYRILNTSGPEGATGVAKCYARGERVTAGGYTTDVWYQVTVHFPGHTYYFVWAWGGNVNVGADPAPGMEVCPA
ncbi:MULTISPECIES: SH3 domain-containing protein [Streptomyces]|uniref:SH3 domain-containing protein n=1 Tax=Streptomyces achmelvichensis TaxID=3134111 RepID=A0ACC6Q2A7_9ACTN